MTKRISEELENKIIELYDSGAYIRNIVKELNISHDTVRIYTKKNNKRRRITYNSSELEKEVLDMYDSGVAIRDIYLKLNIGHGTVYRYLKNSKRNRCISHTFDDNMFSCFTAENCYWAGFIGADGAINKKSNSIRVLLSTKDKGHIKKLAVFSKDKNFVIKDLERTKNKINTFCSFLDINSTKIVKNLNDNFNITPNKCFTLRPPDNIPEELIKHYIRGYFDGDGWISWNKINNNVEFGICSDSADLLLWVSNNIKKQVDYKFSEKSLSVRPTSSIYRIGASGKVAKAIFDWVYLNSTQKIRLDRKYNKYLDYCK